MVFSHNWLQSFFKSKLPEPKKLAELLTLHSFEVEGVRKAGKDWLLNIDITPNRPDCLSHLGLAREYSAITGAVIGAPKSKIKEEKNKVQDAVKIEIKDKKRCRRYVARVLSEVKVGPSPRYIQERLKSCGLDPINNIVDATNYVMLETGQPLHVFDLDKIENANPKSQTLNPKQITNSKLQIPNKIKRIIIREGRKGEEIEALDDKTYQLDENVLVIADAKQPLAIAGIKGGKAAAVDQNTTNVLLESANFEPISIRKASQKLKLKTEASFRFEHGIDAELADFAIERLASLLQEITKGKSLKGKIDFYTQAQKARKIILEINYFNQLLGLDISQNKAVSILNALQIRAKQKTSQKIEAEIPSCRQDLVLPEDLAEEVARIYGYQNIDSIFPVAALIPAEKNQDIAWEHKIKNLLKEAKFTEVYNYSFIPKKLGDPFSKQVVELQNPFSKELYYLRPTLLVNLLLNIEKNLKHFRPNGSIKVFETGKTFQKQGQKIIEKKSLAGAICGKDASFYRLKGLVDFLLNSLGISDVYYDEFEATSEESPQALWNDFRCAEIKVGGQEAGFLGEVSERFLEEVGVKQNVFCFEFDLELLIKLCSEEREYLPVSKYPSAVRDIAVLVPLSAKVGEVMERLYQAGGNLVQDIDLFDIYQGSPLPEEKKNLAFHIVFQSQEKTLSSGEVDELHKKLITALEKNPEWDVRR